MQYMIQYECQNHIGKVRKMNQDNFICLGEHLDERQAGVSLPLRGSVHTGSEVIFGVFDGMGGEECGEVASRIASVCARGLRAGANPPEDLRKFCTEANDRICRYAEENGVHAMGTTAAMLAFTDEGICLCNIGDSKILRYAQGQLDQISVDHVAEGYFGRKAPLSQNLGIAPEEMIIEPYVAVGSYHSQDIYLICSDGLTDMVSMEDIRRVLAEQTFEKTGTVLLHMALKNGGRDNITMILCRIMKEKKGIFRFLHRH